MEEEGRKEKVFSMPDGGAVGTVLITVGMDFLLWCQHTHACNRINTHTCRATCCHSAPPAQHLVIKDQRGLSSLEKEEEIRAKEKERKSMNWHVSHTYFFSK